MIDHFMSRLAYCLYQLKKPKNVQLQEAKKAETRVCVCV